MALAAPGTTRERCFEAGRGCRGMPTSKRGTSPTHKPVELPKLSLRVLAEVLVTECCKLVVVAVSFWALLV